MPDLAVDILANHTIQERARTDAAFAVDLYRALSNNEFFRINGGAEAGSFACSWRYAGGLISRLVGTGTYLDYYCSGDEGTITEEITTLFAEMGWRARDSQDT